MVQTLSSPLLYILLCYACFFCNHNVGGAGKMTLMIVAKTHSDDGNGEKDTAEDHTDNDDSMIVAQTYPNPLFFSNKIWYMQADVPLTVKS